MYEKITFNLGGVKTRTEVLEGKTYLVAPMVKLTPGVWNGSEGPLLYTPNELAKNPMTWNHKPIVLYHPTMNGEGISACDPVVLEKQKVGIILNSAYDGRLKSEAWLDEVKFGKLDSITLNKIKAGTMVEISTGLFHDLEPTPGEYNGKKYVGIVRNIQPDHLAILPDQKGACSIADGGGLLRNAETQELSYEDIRDQIKALLKCEPGYSYCYICDLFPKYAIYEKDAGKCYKIGYKLRNGKVALDGEAEEVRKQTKYVTANGLQLAVNEDSTGPVSIPRPNIGELSDVMRRQQALEALKAKYSGNNPGAWDGWVTTLFANEVIYSKDGKIFSLSYTYADDKITYIGEAEEVEEVTSYSRKNKVSNQENVMAVVTQNAIHQGAHEMLHAAGGTGDAHQTDPSKGDSQVRTAQRKGAVDTLIAKHGYKEEDRKFLESLPDDGFEKVNNQATKGATQVIVPYTYDGIKDRSNVHGAQNQQAPMTVQDYINQAPPAMRPVLVNALSSFEEEKRTLVNNIVANPNNRFTKEWLMAVEDINMLRGLSGLAGDRSPSRPVGNYGGQASIPMFIENSAVVGQNQQQYEDEALPLPSTYDKKTA